MEFKDYCRQSIPEGIILLENDKKTLPLKNGEKIALFGRSQIEYIKSGTGSGGQVNCPYVSNIIDELSKHVIIDKSVTEIYEKFIPEHPWNIDNLWGNHPHRDEPSFSEEFIKTLANNNDKAIFVLGRRAGESYDCQAIKGDYYLLDEEEQTIKLLAKYFDKFAVLINNGNIMDLSWVKPLGVKTLAYIWHGGQEGGNGTVDALMGKAVPSGRLTDTIAKNIYDYPAFSTFGDLEQNIHKEDIYVGYRYFETFNKDAVLYPFGYGLNYTDFETKTDQVKKEGDIITVTATVKNVGDYDGKEVVQVYYSAPSGKLGKPARELIAFKKTDLLKPNESQTLTLSFNAKDMASFDDTFFAVTGYQFCYVLEEGEYSIFVGNNVRDAKKEFSFNIDKTTVVEKLSQRMSPRIFFRRMKEQNGKLVLEKVEPCEKTVYDRVEGAKEIPQNNENIHLQQVKDGEKTLDEFIGSLSVEELTLLARGEGMSSIKAPVPGTAGNLGGVSASLLKKGVPFVTLCDGPSGLRMGCDLPATCFSIGSHIASSWNPDAFIGVIEGCADELKKYNVDVLLGPGMNIHRHVLCGRNFEYFSEDPYITGVFAREFAKHFNAKGVHCTLKHFAVNSQELNRSYEDEVVSERALREIYLKGFEIAVRSGYITAIMTSYNKINGVAASGNYDLTTHILRNEWGYKGLVMTDWWPLITDPRDNSFRGNNRATMLKAQNDIYMVNSDATLTQDDVASSLESGYLTLGELQRCAKNIVKFALNTNAFGREVDADLTLFTCNEEVVYTTQDVEGEIVPNVENGMYFADIEYILEGDSLQQQVVKMYNGGFDPTTFIFKGTDGKKEKIRFKLSVNSEYKIKFDGAKIVSFTLLK